MALLSDLTKLALTQNVGGGYVPEPQDIRRTRRAFDALGYSSGAADADYMDDDLDGAIRSFQRDQGLRDDGWMVPQGETHRAVNRQLGRQRGLLPSILSVFETPFAMEDRVGAGHINKPEDVKAVQSGLGALDILKPIYGDEPSGIMDKNTEAGIRRFQRENDLKEDGWLAPQGETVLALNDTLVKKKQEQAARKPTPSAVQPTRPAGVAPSAPPPKGVNPRQTYINGLDDKDLKKFFENHERPVEHLYLDHLGNVTLGTGKLIPNKEVLKSIPMEVHEKNGVIRPATDLEKYKAFENVKALRLKNAAAKHYDPETKNQLNVRIGTKAIEQVLDESIRIHLKSVKTKVPDFDRLPVPAQKALLDMDFNMGPNFNRVEWSAFFKHLDNRNWDGMAKESRRGQLKADRNDEVRNLFLESKSQQ